MITWKNFGKTKDDDISIHWKKKQLYADISVQTFAQLSSVQKKEITSRKYKQSPQDKIKAKQTLKTNNKIKELCFDKVLKVCYVWRLFFLRTFICFLTHYFLFLSHWEPLNQRPGLKYLHTTLSFLNTWNYSRL